MLAKTKQTNEKMIMNKTAAKGIGYTKPHEHSVNIQRNVRNQKEADADLRFRLTAEVRNEFPAGTDEFVNSTVTRKIWEMEQASHVPPDPELTLRPNMKKTLKKETVIERHHTGVWQVDPTSKKGKMCWSCCGNRDHDGDGCVIKKRDKMKWNVDGM